MPNTPAPPVNWKAVRVGRMLNAPGQPYARAIESGVNSTLYQWGPVIFQVHPLNLHEVDHETATDWAHKEIAGAAIYREWVGENDEVLNFRGRVFPYRIGGYGMLEAFDILRRAGSVNLMVRGKGDVLGWFVCEKLLRAHTYLSGEGMGQEVAFEAVMARAPAPANDMYLSDLWAKTVSNQ